MSDADTPGTTHTETPEGSHTRGPRLLTISEAASATGLSRKAIERRVDRGTLRTVHDERGWRMVPRAELERAELLGEGTPGVGGGREVVIWRDLYERERQEHDETRENLINRADEERRNRDQAEAAAAELREQLAAIANAGPIRAMSLRRALRASGVGEALVHSNLDAPPPQSA